MRYGAVRCGAVLPNLELAAATLATRINKVVTKELEVNMTINNGTYWPDSMIVKYIANEKRRLVTFVANQVADRAKSVASRKIRPQSSRLRLSKNQSLRDQET